MVAPKTIQEDSTLLSPTQVADELGVHRSTVHNWLKSGLMHSEKHGAFHAVTKTEMKRFRVAYLDDGKAPKKKGAAK